MSVKVVVVSYYTDGDGSLRTPRYNDDALWPPVALAPRVMRWGGVFLCIWGWQPASCGPQSSLAPAAL